MMAGMDTRVLDVIRQNKDIIQVVLALPISERSFAIADEVDQMEAQGYKLSYCVAYAADKYNVSERSVYRYLNLYRQKLNEI